MPELRQFPKGYDYAFNDFTAFVLVENEAAGYRRFIDYDPNLRVSRLIKAFTPIFFITTDERDALIDANRLGSDGELQPVSSHTIELAGGVFSRLPSSDINRWQLVVNNSVAKLISEL